MRAHDRDLIRVAVGTILDGLRVFSVLDKDGETAAALEDEFRTQFVAMFGHSPMFQLNWSAWVKIMNAAREKKLGKLDPIKDPSDIKEA